MIAAMANKDLNGRRSGDTRPGDTDMHRRQRGKNLFMLAVLLVIAIAFFALTMVRMGGMLPS
jgi:hypothetical protein